MRPRPLRCKPSKWKETTKKAAAAVPILISWFPSVPNRSSPSFPCDWKKYVLNTRITSLVNGVKSSCHHVLCKAILEGELCVDVPKCHPLLQMGIKNQKLLKLHALQSRIFLLTQQLTREVCELIVYTACLSWLLKNNNCPQKNVACQLPIKSRRYRVIFVLLLRKKITIFEFYKKKKCTVDIRTMYYSIHSVSGTTVYLINSRTCLCVQCGNTMYMYVHIFVKWVYYRARFHNYQKCFGLQVKIKWLMKKLFLPSDNWKAFWNYQHHYYKIEYKRQYLIKFMTKKKILKPNWKSCLIFA